MAIELTNRTENALRQTNIEPKLIVKIDGYDTLFTSTAVEELIKIGDPGLFIDGSWFIGGLRPIDNQKTYVDLGGTTTTIRQQMNFDEARGSSISTMNIAMVDKNEEITALISPGIELEEILGRKFKIFLSFGQTSFFEDSILLFTGFTTTVDSGPGNIKFKLNHPDNKKKVELFTTAETDLDGNINATQTSLDLTDGSTFFEPTGPLRTYIRIEDEIIEYTGISNVLPNQLTGLVRGALGSTAVAHDDEEQVQAFYTLEGNPLDLALQIMLSGFGIGNPVYENVSITNFVRVGSGSEQVSNSIFFRGVNVPQEYNITAGDTATITGASNGANNVTNAVVNSVEQFEDGYYIVFDSVSFVEELDTSATINFFSQWNTLPDGMKLRPDEVDTQQHIYVRDFFQSSTQMIVTLKQSETNGKEFLEEQLYRPIACYAVPRKTRSSVAFTVGPIPGVDIKTLDETNIRNPESLRLIRTTKEGFFNRVFYKFEDGSQEPAEKYLRGRLRVQQDSIDRIGEISDLIIESNGLREGLNAANIIDSNAQRYLRRYAFAAEYINPVVQLSTALSIEINDIVVVDLRALKVSDTTLGNRLFEPRLFQVKNKTLNILDGKVELSCLDTGINIETRYALMSPCSMVATVLNNRQIVIKPDPFYTAKYGADEFRKWNRIIGPRDPIAVQIRDKDFTNVHTNLVTNIDGNTFTFENDLAGTVAADQLIEFDLYSASGTSQKQKLVYGYMTDDPQFADGQNQYTMF